MLVDKYQPYRRDVNFIKKYMQAVNAASGSEVDSNSNVSSKNIATMAPEIHKKDNIYANRLWMHDRITEMFGEELADEYIRQLEEHEIYRHDETLPIGFPYCASVSLYPFLINGMKELGGTSIAPKHFHSWLGGFANLVFAISSELCGATATPEFLPYTDHFLRKEYGNDYYLHTDMIVNPILNETLGQMIDRGFEQVIYSINQPAAARGSQSVFFNIAYYDKPYFDGLFEDFVFPDGDVMQWESVSWLQKRFMKWFNNERTRNILTFPVETMNLLNDGEKFVDEEWADFAAEMYAEGHSFFTYTSQSVDSLASCCFSGNTRILAKSSSDVFLNTTFEELYRTHSHKKNNFTVYHNGSWVSAKVVRLSGRQMYTITTANKKVVSTTDNHLWPTLDGLKRTDQLTTNDWLMFNTRALDVVKEKDRHLTYNQGLLIGMYLGDGSIYCANDRYYTVNYSLNENKYLSNINKMNQGLIDIGITDKEFVLRKPYNNVYPVALYGSMLPAFIYEYVSGTCSHDKRIKGECFIQSKEFRQGILDGFYATDGGNSNRIYTTSEQLCYDLEALCSTLGYCTVIDVSDRTNEAVVIRDNSYKRNYPLYCIRWYDSKNRRSMSNVFKVVNNSIYFKVNNIEKSVFENPEYVYCFECKNEEEPYFTLPNGMITHNCRLKNSITDNTFSYTLGAGGISTGSKCVMTMNVNRLVQNCIRDLFGDDNVDIGEVRNESNFEQNLVDISQAVAVQVEKMHKYLLAFNSILMDMYNSHMIPLYDAGFVSPDKQYLTIGVNSVLEAAEFLGIDIGDNEKYKAFINSIFEPIYKANKAAKTKDIMFNTEMVPAENLGVKFAKWDSKDGYEVPRECYNSYLYKVEDESTSIIDKFRLYGKEYTSKLDGGSALHANLDEHLSKVQYRFLMDLAVKEGTPYFTFNVPNTICNDCGFISKHKLDKCPKCESENLDYATRIIG